MDKEMHSLIEKYAKGEITPEEMHVLEDKARVN